MPVNIIKANRFFIHRPYLDSTHPFGKHLVVIKFTTWCIPAALLFFSVTLQGHWEDCKCSKHLQQMWISTEPTPYAEYLYLPIDVDLYQIYIYKKIYTDTRRKFSQSNLDAEMWQDQPFIKKLNTWAYDYKSQPFSSFTSEPSTKFDLCPSAFNF